MTKERFTGSPFPELHVTDVERRELISLADAYVEEYIQKYKDYVAVDRRAVNKRRWQHVKSRDNLHVYGERSRRAHGRRGTTLESSLSCTQQLNAVTDEKDLSVLLGVGTVSGELEDLMFGVLSPTLDDMRVSASYVQHINDGAVLASVVEPSKDDPFRSLVIKWMAIDSPLPASNLVRSRDFVYIEATGIVTLPNDIRVGYCFRHSIDFPQTEALPNKIRGNLSVFSCFRQISRNTIDTFCCATVDPGRDTIRALLASVVANFLLAATNYVYCGQMKKLAWMLKHRRAAFLLSGKERHSKKCVVCRKSTRSVMGSIAGSSCKLCSGVVCYSCKISQRLSFNSVCGRLLQRKIVFCGICVSAGTNMDATEPASDRVNGFDAFTASSSVCTYIDSSMSSLDG
ncbi:hypothetical protein PF004_g16780 [Phytophthora fragariae]|uniref:FYVE-type domain-containing protein n=2 Tax=Phytophthora fragariae TaxID=53985 RepID=A0A6G0RIM6_9STRA|nr:hypothetical protein PF004_g16780 [Phytophthora fragariae]KAE9334590.1 hypothetical protein PF008_g13893 [Phytophthora fragariae]